MKSNTDLIKEYLGYLANNPLVGEPAELYDPANYILSLGGKRVRPLLVLLSYQLKENDIPKALPLAHAAEVFHNFTLMHDDIMDNANLRRNSDTVHVKWNTSIAILSGDMMLVKAYQIINQLDTTPEVKTRLMDRFGEMAEQVCVGQQHDMNFENADNVRAEDYIQMITGKTSVLLAFCLQAGAILAGLSEEVKDKLYSFGLNTGIAFQIMDDYLDTFGNASNFGKKIGGDILENKKTLLWIEAKKRCNSSQLETLNTWYSTTETSEAKITEVTQLFKEVEADKAIIDLMNQYRQLAHDDLEFVSKSYDVSNLIQLSEDLQQRVS